MILIINILNECTVQTSVKEERKTSLFSFMRYVSKQVHVVVIPSPFKHLLYLSIIAFLSSFDTKVSVIKVEDILNSLYKNKTANIVIFSDKKFILFSYPEGTSKMYKNSEVNNIPSNTYCLATKCYSSVLMEEVSLPSYNELLSKELGLSNDDECYAS